MTSPKDIYTLLPGLGSIHLLLDGISLQVRSLLNLSRKETVCEGNYYPYHTINGGNSARTSVGPFLLNVCVRCFLF
jgi:hypothetical protein